MRTPRGRGSVARAWTETKLAVRAYSKNPTKENESQVRLACSHLRDESAVTPYAAHEYWVKAPVRMHG